jgi:hypothetical protein
VNSGVFAKKSGGRPKTPNRKPDAKPPKTAQLLQDQTSGTLHADTHLRFLQSAEQTRSFWDGVVADWKTLRKKSPVQTGTGPRKAGEEKAKRLLLPRTLLVAICLQALPALVLVHLQTTFLFQITHVVRIS